MTNRHNNKNRAKRHSLHVSKWCIGGAATALLLMVVLTLHPTLSVLLIPGQAKSKIVEFISTASSVQEINPQQFWETRNRSSNGVFDFKREGFRPDEILKHRRIAPLLIQKEDTTAFLTYISSEWTSIEYLTSISRIDELGEILPKNCDIMLIKTPQVLMCKSSEDRIRLLFLASVQDMITANGYFDIKGQDKDRIAGKYWLVISDIYLR